ncbi:MAG: transcriptional regulator [Lachnospiraceae bacterium]|nr:transcriptional regulator [Lachnospiraceae bacterium]
MGIRSAKDAIREARQKAGLTQENLSEGVCSMQSLSRIETGTAGISPATFQALMERAGAPCERFPVFASRDDFDCFYALKHARFYLDAWQLTPAWKELQKLEGKNWADNRLYYQEWLLLHCRLQSRSYCCTHSQNYELLLKALHITRPSIDLSNFHQLILSQNELQLLIALSHEAFYLGQYENCLQICIQVKDYLSGCHFTTLEIDHMQAESAIVYTKYLLMAKNYDDALNTADTHRHKMAINADTASLFELTFLTGLCYYYKDDLNSANLHIKAAFYSAHAVDCCYATICRDFLRTNTDFPITDYMENLPDIPLKTYPVKSYPDTLCLSDGVYNIDSTDAYTLGKLIQELRLEQHVSQQVLCQGLCSKSKLSKIENGTLQPNIALAEALLQRLGVSERIFTFWGNEKEAKLYELKFKLIHHQIMKKETRKNLLCEMEHLLDDNDILYRQIYLAFKSLQSDSINDKITGLFNALHITLPNFDIHQIHRYRLSWEELSLLNNIAHEYRCTGESYLSTLYFLQILSYVKTTKPDILLQAIFLPNTNQMYCHSLYVLKLHHEVINLANQIDLSIMNFNINLFGGYLFCYSQSLGECANWKDAILTATQACAFSDLMELYKNTDILHKYFLTDFSINLKY